MADLEGKINLSGPAGMSYGGGSNDGVVSPTMQGNEGGFKNTLDEPVLETIVFFKTDDRCLNCLEKRLENDFL